MDVRSIPRSQRQSSTSIGHDHTSNTKLQDRKDSNNFCIPPPLPLLPTKAKTSDPIINTGLNMYFKKLESFS